MAPLRLPLLCELIRWAGMREVVVMSMIALRGDGVCDSWFSLVVCGANTDEDVKSATTS